MSGFKRKSTGRIQPGVPGGKLALVESMAASASGGEAFRDPARLAGSGTGQLGESGQHRANERGNGGGATGSGTRQSLWFRDLAKPHRETPRSGIHAASARSAQEKSRRPDAVSSLLRCRRAARTGGELGKQRGNELRPLLFFCLHRSTTSFSLTADTERERRASLAQRAEPAEMTEDPKGQRKNK